MPKTIIVSNRLPIEFKISEEGLESRPSVGGLATGLKTVHAAANSIWIGWPGLTSEQMAGRENEIQQRSDSHRAVIVSLSQNELRDFYFGFSNKSLWPLFHYFLQYTMYNASQWQAYKQVNEKFAQTVLQHANPGDRIWVHDYQLMLVPQLIREQRPDVSIGFFLHIPFPAFEIFRTCPWREELLSGLLGADLIGFHTYDYVQHFLNSVRRILGHPIKFNEIDLGEKTVRVDAFPMGIDYARYRDAALQYRASADEPSESDMIERLKEHMKHSPESRLILSIDRLDYTKGIPNRLLAFEHFLQKYPEYTGKVRLVMLSVPSREDVPHYRMLKRQTDALVGRINGKFGTINWIPIWYFYRSMPFEDLVALYSSADVALITPLRDGMNLVAKEYIATRTDSDGVLILSEMAGAANELSQAIQINPENHSQIAAALHESLQLPKAEQQKRMQAMQKRISRYHVERWASDFMKSLEKSGLPSSDAASCLKITPEISRKLVSEFNGAGKKLVLLDYDGTLVGFRENPEEAVPDEELYDLLDRINTDPNTEVAIISGRNRGFLARWFDRTAYTLISDHGVWMRRSSKEWQKLEDPRTEWKTHIRPIMEDFVDRTPGAFIEEKEFSIAWHYRRVADALGEVRERELRLLLAGMVGDHNLSVLEGNKVLEVKNSLVNKGRAVTRLIRDGGFNFVFAAGDDHTDEYMFAELPEMAQTVKVGTSKTVAKYYTPNPEEFRRLMHHFAN